MINYQKVSDTELAEMLSNWMSDAANSWSRFNDREKWNFRRMQDEACKRFIEQHTKEAADE